MNKKITAGLAAISLFASVFSMTAMADDDTTITVAASPTPHAEILEQAKPLLEKQGCTLDIKVFEDYVQPNKVVDSGEMDANYFQHIPYLENFNEENGTDLVNAGGIHYEPMGIFPGTKSSLDDVEEGDTIALPNDPTNEARALLLLQDNGLLTLKSDAGINATVAFLEPEISTSPTRRWPPSIRNTSSILILQKHPFIHPGAVLHNPVRRRLILPIALILTCNHAQTRIFRRRNPIRTVLINDTLQGR